MEKQKLLRKLEASKTQKEANKNSIKILIEGYEKESLVLIKNVSTGSISLLECREKMEGRWDWRTSVLDFDLIKNFFYDQRIKAEKWKLPFSPF